MEQRMTTEAVKRSVDRMLAMIARDRGCRVVELDPMLRDELGLEVERLVQIEREAERAAVTARLLEEQLGDRSTPLLPEGYEHELPREQGRLPRGVGR